VIQCQPGVTPLTELLQRGAYYPLANRDDQARFFIHCGVRILQQRHCIPAIVRVNRDANTAPGMQSGVIDHEGLTQFFYHPVREKPKSGPENICSLAPISL
jgi:hypothetical protein